MSRLIALVTLVVIAGANEPAFVQATIKIVESTKAEIVVTGKGQR